ncbi:MAG TPA: phosphate ABC transporter substrate-binding protein [Ramlibacter sp.]|nr:phosphate ABC transporter substrate-binding protein [Ramlibacter sp.]
MTPELVRSLLRAAAVLAAAVSSSGWAQERIILDGSTGMIPLAKAVAQVYQQKSPDNRAEVGQGLGTSARLKAVADGSIHIALASHGVTKADLEKNGLRSIDVAKGAIVFAVHASVPLGDISEQQVCDLFSGRTANWKGLNGPDAAVVVLTRPPVEVDPEVIRAKVACFKDLKEVDSARVMARGGDMAKGLAETPHAIGMTSMTVVEQSGGKLRALALNGIAPSAENVKAGRYFLTRDFLFVVKAAPSPSVARFLDFVMSAHGDAVITGSGAIPLR